jgi:hypothetical protein
MALARHSGLIGFRPRSQRRDRSRISRDSLLNSQYLMVIEIMVDSDKMLNDPATLVNAILIARGLAQGA